MTDGIRPAARTFPGFGWHSHKQWRWRIIFRMNHRFAVFLLPMVALLAGFLVACSRDPNLAKVKYLESGQRYADKGKYQEAEIQFKNALQLDASYAPARYQLAQTYLKMHQWKPAFEALSRTVELQPDNYLAHIDLLNLVIAGRDFRTAQAELDLLQKKQPDSPAVHLAAANLLIAQEKYEDAQREITTAIRLAPGESEPYERLATLQMRMTQPEQAESNFKKAVQLNPKATSSLLALAGYYQSQGRFPEAEQQLRQAISNDADNPEPRANLIRLYMAEGKASEAEQYARQVTHDFPRNSVGYRMLGDFYFATRNFDGALAEYKTLYREHPGDLQVQKNYLQLLIIKDQLDEAKKLDSLILKANPGDVDALIDRGEMEFRLGDFAASVDALQSALRYDPQNGLAYYHLGLAFERLGEPNQAQNAWQSAIGFRPDLSDAQIAMTRAEMRKGDMAGLEHSATEIIRLLPDSPVGYAMRAYSFTQRGQFARAEQDAGEALRRAPQDPSGYLQMGTLNLARKRYPDAESFFRQALDRDSGSAEALAGLMATYLFQNQREKAVAAAEAQIAANPKSSAFYDLLATAQYKNRPGAADVDAAELNFKKAIELDKTNTDAWIKLAGLQSAKGQSEEAIATAGQALQVNPKETALYILAGQLYESKQDWSRAADSYQKALDIDPNQPLASNNLAYLLTRTGGNLDIALSLAQNARRGMPDSPNAADTLGWVLYETGAYHAAIDTFQQALKLAEKSKVPDSPTVHYHLGMAYEKTGESALARQQLEKVLKISPNYSEAEDVRRLLDRLRG
jgi:tetratricopeptide (TPR) repeat protein